MSYDPDLPAAPAPRVPAPAATSHTGSGRDAPCWTRYIALGDSFTEGLWDPYPYPDGSSAPAGTASAATQRGWADRLADALSRRRVAAGQGALEYANLAIRGRLLGQILDQQLPLALSAAPDLVSLVGGGNDLLRPHADLEHLTERIDDAVGTLRAAGTDVLLAAGFTGSGPMSLTRGRTGAYNSNLWSIARQHGAYVLDLWGMESIASPRMWADDRLHLTPQGHRRVTDAALVALGLDPDDEEDDGSAPAERTAASARLARARADAHWARIHVLPWVRRRVRGVSSGDSLTAKWPEPILWHEP